jgi:hypothetical protein
MGALGALTGVRRHCMTVCGGARILLSRVVVWPSIVFLLSSFDVHWRLQLPIIVSEHSE